MMSLSEERTVEDLSQSDFAFGHAPNRPAVLAPLDAWTARCPCCHASLAGVPVTIGFCRRCGTPLMHITPDQAGLEGWLPKSLMMYELKPAVTIRRVGLLAAAADPLVHADVAIQLMQIDGNRAGPWRHQFDREIQAIPHLAYGMEGQLLWVAIEIAQGWTLADWLRQQKKTLALETVRKLMLQLTTELSGAHSRGIWPIGLRSDSVLVNAKGDAKFTSFGWIESLPSIASLVTGAGADQAADDIFGLGTIWHELILKPGAPIRQTDPGPGIRDDCPPGWLQLIQGCLSPIAGQRPSLDQIERELHRDPHAPVPPPLPKAPPPLPAASPPPPPRPPGTPPPLPKNRGYMGWVILLILIGGACWLIAEQRQSSTPATATLAIQQAIDASTAELLQSGRSAIDARQWDRAIDQLTKYTQAMPADSDGFAWLATAYLGRSASAGAALDQSSAQDALEMSLSINPRNAFALAKRGVLRTMQGRPDLARQDYQAALAIDGNLAWARQNLANLQTDVPPRADQTLIRLAEGKLQSHGWDEAIVLLNSYHARNAPSAAAYAGLANAYYGRGYDRHDHADFTAAESYAGKALALDPRNVSAMQVMGLLREKDQRFVEARQWYDRILAIDHLNHWARQRRDALQARSW